MFKTDTINHKIIMYALGITGCGFLISQIYNFNLLSFYIINSFCEHYLNASLIAHITDLGDGALCGSLAILICLYSPLHIKRLLVTVLVTAIVSTIFKELFLAPRPALLLNTESFNILGLTHKNFSFPSGHTMAIFSLVGFYIVSFENKLMIFGLVLLGSLVALSRVAVGAHWPEDILAGAFLGIICSIASVKLSGKAFSEKGSYYTAIFLCTLCILAISLAKNEFPTIVSVQYVRFGFLILNISMIIFCIKKINPFFRKNLMLKKI